MVVAGPDDLVNAVARDRRMVGYRVRRQGDAWIELEVIAQRARSPVLLVLAWPDVWRDAMRLQPHLVVEREDQRHVGAIAAHAQCEQLAVPFDVGEPHGTPARLAVDAYHGAADVGP